MLSRADIEVKCSSLSGLALLDEILGFDRVVVVDAVQSQNHKVGDIFQIEFQELEGLPRGGSPHYVGLPSLLHYCRQYGLGAPDKIQVLGIEVEDPSGLKHVENVSFNVLRRAVADKILIPHCQQQIITYSLNSKTRK